MNVNKTLEKVLEEAVVCGELKLVGRRLKDFPKMAYKYNLTDTVFADLSKNRFTELPEEITMYPFLEKLVAYHNIIRSIPESISNMNSLQFLDIRNNHLQSLPKEICFLPLKVLLVSNNRLHALPEEIGRLETLTELDAARNQIALLPVKMGFLKHLKSLNLRNNQLVYLPRDLCSLQLLHFDISSNRISSLPTELRLMTSLIYLNVDSNPLSSPPASLCMHGLIHIFKFLEIASNKDEKDGGVIKYKNLTAKTTMPHAATIPLERKRQIVSNLNENRVDGDSFGMQTVHNFSNDHNLIDFKKQENNNKSDSSLPTSPIKNNLSQIQTYKEYKEALKQQRQDVYRKEVNTEIRVSFSTDYNESLTPSILSPKTTNGSVNGNHIQNGNDSPYIKPNCPIKSNVPCAPETSVSHYTAKKMTKTVSWNRDIPASDSKNFTMRREYDRQKEETELITQLREIIKSRLKINLSDDLSFDLCDGVVLCHLANYVKPRSVASIHVPSATTPRLTVTRCRRNVDNFLDACRKIGVDEKLVCCAADILEGKGVVQIAITVVELLKFHSASKVKSPSFQSRSFDDS